MRHTAARMQPGRGCGDRPPGQPLQSLHVTEQHFVRSNISCHDTCDIVYSDRVFFHWIKKKPTNIWLPSLMLMVTINMDSCSSHENTTQWRLAHVCPFPVLLCEGRRLVNTLPPVEYCSVSTEFEIKTRVKYVKK